MDAQTRRRERRAEKQAQWKAANPLLVGVSAKPVNRPILSLNRKPKSRVESALNPIDLTVLAEYHEQIESNLQRIEAHNSPGSLAYCEQRDRFEMQLQLAV
ncbi:antitermination protein N [Escherichia coli]|uniref:antitermination protein N n=1 Tax=Escherichia coli TaxID=562 RepID=UPI003D6803CA